MPTGREVALGIAAETMGLPGQACLAVLGLGAFGRTGSMGADRAPPAALGKHVDGKFSRFYEKIQKYKNLITTISRLLQPPLSVHRPVRWW